MKRWILFFLCAILPLSALALSVGAENEAESVRLPVVMYHHISRRSGVWNDYVVSPEEFAGDLDYLRAQGYESIRLSQLLDWVEGRAELPEKPCLITFDDGFESTLAYAEPLLKEKGFTAVVAVIGSVCEKFSECDEHDAELSNLSWEDAVGLTERGVIEVQCHTWDMHRLSPRRGCAPRKGEGEEAYGQALRADLQRFLSVSRENGLDIVPAIAYPYGAYSHVTTAVIRQMGFRAAFTCEERVNVLRPEAEELFQLARYNRPHGIDRKIFFGQWEKSLDKRD